MNYVHDVFISYRRFEDEERRDGQGTHIAREIYDYLTSKGLRVFLDEEEMENGPFPEQLKWQIIHAPNFLYIATSAALTFRQGPNTDHVREELRLALSEYEKAPSDRSILPIVPRYTSIPDESDERYPAEIHKLFFHHAPNPLEGRTPSEKNLKEILERVTKVNRGNLWNAGYRWLLRSKEPKSRFAGLDVNPEILPLAAKDNEQNIRLPIRAYRMDEEHSREDAPLIDMIRNTAGHLYLVGEGGIGKTTALYSIMEYAYNTNIEEAEINRTHGQVPLFVELSQAPDTYGRLYEGGKSTFIHRAVFRQLRADLKAKQVSSMAIGQVEEVFDLSPELSWKPIHDLFTRNTPAPEYLLLLDGLNEVSRTQITHERMVNGRAVTDVDASVASMVIREIRQLMSECANVRVIMTSRSREESGWGDNATVLYLSGVKDESIERYMLDRGISDQRIRKAKSNIGLWKILHIPLFLTLYASLEGEEELLTRGEILNLFFHQKRERLYSEKIRGNEIEQDVADAASAQQVNRLTASMQAFILDFILPEIGWSMVRDNEFAIHMLGKRKGSEGLKKLIWRILTDHSDTAVCGSYGCETYVAYRNTGNAKSSTRQIAREICKRLSWNATDDFEIQEDVVSGIVDCAVMSLGVLRVSSGEGMGYSFIHHHIRDYFAAMYQVNRMRLAVFLYEYGEEDAARSCLNDWKAMPLPTEVRRYIGEALGEAHNVPAVEQDGSRRYNVPGTNCDRNLIRRCLDMYRNRFEGEDGYAVWNLLEILKDVRADLAGEDFSRLDLRNCEVNGCVLGERGCAVNLKGALLTESFFMPRGHSEEISSLMFSRDGRFILTAANDVTVMIWDARTLQEIAVLVDENQVEWIKSAQFSPDERNIVVASRDGVAYIWNVESKRVIGKMVGHTQPINSARYGHMDGKRILTASSDMTARVWDAETRQEIGCLVGHTDKVYFAEFSPDNKLIATVSSDKTLRLWNAESFLEICCLEGHTGSVRSVAFSPDGKCIVTASVDRTARVWDVIKKEQIGILKGHTGTVRRAIYSDDGKRIITASSDKTVRLWDAVTLEEVETLGGYTSKATNVACSPDGRFIAVASGYETAWVWDMHTRHLYGMLKGHTRSSHGVVFSPNGSCIAASIGDAVRIWDTGTLQEIGVLKGHSGHVRGVDYSPDGKYIVTGANDYTARVWNVRSLQMVGVLEGHTNYVNTVAYSPDGKYIATGSRDGTVRMWDAKKFIPIGVPIDKHRFEVSSVAFSRDGRYMATAANDRFVRVWEVSTGRELAEWSGHERGIGSVAFSSDGKNIASASDDGTVRVWDLITKQQIALLKGFEKGARSVVYSPDGKSIANLSITGIVKIWDANTFFLLKEMDGKAFGGTSIVYSKDGRFIAASFADGTVRVWDANTYERVYSFHNVPGLEVINVDLRNLHPGFSPSPTLLNKLKEHGAIVE